MRDVWLTLIKSAIFATIHWVPVQQREEAGVVAGLATAVRVTIDRLVTNLELELGRGEASRDVR